MKITYIHHSSFMAELDHAVLLFDYFEGNIPETDREKPLFVFASHRHGDHFSRSIFDLEESRGNVTYVLSDDIWTRQVPEELLGRTIFLGPGEEVSLKDGAGNPVDIQAFKSTDQGVAFLASLEGRTIYHAGDLNWWYWNGEPEDDNEFMVRFYKEEVARLKGREIDLAFLLLDPRQEDKYCKGINYFIEEIQPKAVFPMHAFGEYKISRHYLNCDDGRAYQGIVREITKAGEEFVL